MLRNIDYMGWASAHIRNLDRDSRENSRRTWFVNIPQQCERAGEEHTCALMQKEEVVMIQGLPIFARFARLLQTQMTRLSSCPDH